MTMAQRLQEGVAGWRDPEAVRLAGVGRALVDAAEDWGRRRGRKRVVVDTGAADAPARRFYAALGFEEEDITISRAIGTRLVPRASKT